jgi:hypothetical protein
MRERDVVWEHRENLFPGFKCKYCVKRISWWWRYKVERVFSGENGNVARCTKCPPDIREYFLRELQRVRERKKTINDERLHRM